MSSLPHHWCPEVARGAVEQVAAALPDAVRAAPLGPLTTLKVGGPAALLVEAADAADVVRVLAAVGDRVPLLVVGRGSNLLVSDEGWPGLVLRLGHGLRATTREGTIVTAGAAVAMPALAAWCASQGLSGLEFAAGVPATVGGSVRMNAGAHGGETATALSAVCVATASGLRTLTPAELHFGYRTSQVPPGAVVTGATWQLTAADPDAVRADLDELRAWRRTHQPLGERTCGSVFTNPPGDSAGRLIEAAGLKGLRLGTARVSPLHANFIEADRGGLADDVARVIVHVRRVVADAHGVELVPEVRAVGRFPALA